MTDNTYSTQRFLSAFLCQSGMCGCEKGFTEVMTTNGFLDYCTKTPGSDYKKANVKRSGGRLRRMHKQNESKPWTLQPLGPGGKRNQKKILQRVFIHCPELHISVFPCSKDIIQRSGVLHSFHLRSTICVFAGKTVLKFKKQLTLVIENQLSLFKAYICKAAHK